jgi:hypothetical protein
MNQRCIATALWAALSLPAASMAGQPEAWEYLSNCACEPAPVAVTQPPADSAFGAPEGAARLEQARGGDAGIASDTRLTGTVTANTATNVATGSNIIQSGSFANASGVPIVIQNTGANVLIQNATVINLQLK